VRARVLLMVGSVVAFYYFERGTRPSVWQIVAMAFFVFYVIAGVVGIYREQGGNAAADGVPTMAAVADKFIESANIVSPTAVYVHWIPIYGYDWGKRFLNLLLTPIPSVLWPDKYLFFGQSPVEAFRPHGAMAAFFTEFYASFGPIGVVLGMALVGWGCRRVYDAYLRDPHSPLTQITLALLWAYLFHAYGRNGVSLIVYGCVYVFAPVYVVHRSLLRRGRIRASTAQRLALDGA